MRKIKKEENLDKSYLVEDFNIAHRKTPSTVKIHKHYHNAYEILVQNNGSGEFFIKDNNYLMEPKTLFIINEFDIHRTIVKKELKTYDRFVIQIKPDFLNSYFNYIEDDFKPIEIFKENIKCIKLNDREHKKIKYLSEKMVLELTKKEAGYQSIIHAYLLELFVIIYRLLKNTQFDLVKEKGKEEDRLQKIISFIDDNYKDKITLKAIAEELYISKYYLSHFFKDKTGFTVIEFVNNKRIIEAQKMLANTNLNITDIAMNVGFNTLNHFERTFKGINGVTPTQYRDINNNKF